MNRILSLILPLFFSQSLEAQTISEVESKFKSLHWLHGNWERVNVKPGVSANEKWQPDSPLRLTGLGVTMRGPDTLFRETLQLLIKDNNIYYVADIKENPAPVYFKLTAVTPTGFVCENQQHDFPKKIEYQLSDSVLKVKISGDGKAQSFAFVKRAKNL